MQRQLCETDHRYFQGALERVTVCHTVKGIGTYQEKTIHAVLKQYLEPLSEMQEYKVDRYVADIVNENGICEIQTGAYARLIPKLTAFLPLTHVTVICPILHTKYLCWTDPDTGEITARNRSPKTGIPLDCCWEIWNIRQFLFHPNFSVRLILMDGEEYKLRNGRGKNRSHYASWLDKLPTALYEEYLLSSPGDWLELLPNLAPQFTVKEFAEALHRSVERARTILLFYTDTGLMRRAGKVGRSYCYEMTPQEERNLTYGNTI